MKDKLDKAWFGLVVGLIIPIICDYAFLKTNGIDGFSITDLLRLINSNGMIIKFLCITIFPNMAGVFLLNTLEMWKACRGMFTSIFIYVAVCLIYIFSI